jgi:Flp pilus assembly protein TadB
MQQNPLAALTKEQLIGRLKMAKFTVIFMGVCVLMMLGSGVYITIQRGFSIFLLIPIAFMPLMLLNVTNYKRIKKELSSRQ